MKDKRTEDIIRAYLAGEDSPEGEALFREWYASFRDQSTLEISEAEKEKLREDMLRTIKRRQRRRVSVIPTYRIAASLAGFFLLVGIGIWYYFTQQLLEVNTTNAEVQELILPDGSEVMLNANSSLRYAAAWSRDDAREVWLEGEAFFSVTQTSDDQKFIVYTPNLRVRVLGTSFNVRYRREQTAVVLTEGVVEAYTPSAVDRQSPDRVSPSTDVADRVSPDRVIMEPGDYVQYASQLSGITKKATNPQTHTAWVERQLVLDNTSLREIAALLEDYYGFEVVIAEEQLGELRLSATNTLSLENPEVLLTAIAEIFSLKVKQDQRTIYLEKK